jgi:hypothetical protein
MLDLIHFYVRKSLRRKKWKHSWFKKKIPIQTLKNRTFFTTCSMSTSFRERKYGFMKSLDIIIARHSFVGYVGLICCLFLPLSSSAQGIFDSINDQWPVVGNIFLPGDAQVSGEGLDAVYALSGNGDGFGRNR